MQDGAGTEQQTVRMLQRGSQLVSVWSPPLSSFQLSASSKLCSLLSSGLCCFKSWVRGVFTSDNNDLGVAYSLKFNFVPSIPFSHRIMWKNKQGSLSEYDIICRQYHFFITKNKSWTNVYVVSITFVSPHRMVKFAVCSALIGYNLWLLWFLQEQKVVTPLIFSVKMIL